MDQVIVSTAYGILEEELVAQRNEWNRVRQNSSNMTFW